MAEDRYFRVRITTPRLAEIGQVLVYTTAVDIDQQKDCAGVSREYGYDEADMLMVAAIKNVKDILSRPHQLVDEVIPLSAKEISRQEAAQSFEILRKKS